MRIRYVLYLEQVFASAGGSGMSRISRPSYGEGGEVNASDLSVLSFKTGVLGSSAC